MCRFRSVSHLLFVAGVVYGLGYDTIGELRPAGETAISLSIPNQGEFADYTFNFIPATTIPQKGLLVVTFPQQYQSGLGVAGNPSCTGGTCSLSGLIVTVTLYTSCTTGQTASVTIHGIKNPSVTGGTGPFVLVSYQGVNILDQNAVFGVVGIEGPVGTLTTGSVQVTSGSSVYAGDLSSYDFYFRSALPLYVGSWVRFTFPGDGFVIASVPPCSPIILNSFYLPGIIWCSASNNQVVLYGINQEVPGGTNVGYRITGYNPPKSVSTGTFTIETGRRNTTVVYARISGIPGITISPGRLSGVGLVPDDTAMLLTTSKVVQYTLQFTLKNPVPVGGTIVITGSFTFNMDGLSNMWVNSGLTDLSVTKQVTLAYSIPSKALTISNFAQYTAGPISMNLEMRNPVASGKTTPLIIQSFNSDGVTLMDQDNTSAFVTISINSAPAITSTFLGSNQATGGNIPLQFNFIPQVTIPASGFIKMRVPTGFTVNTATPTCAMKPLNIGLDVPAACTYTGGVLTLQLFIVTAILPAGPGTFNLGQSSYIQITVGLVAPVYAGNYVFDFLTYTPASTLLESGTCTVTIIAQSFTTATVTSLHSLVSKPTVLTVSFTPLLSVPLSQTQTVSTGTQGYIELQFQTMDNAGNLQFMLDLGLGLVVGSTLPCVSITGITPTASSSLTCTLTTQPSNPSAVTNLYLTLANFSAISAATVVSINFPSVRVSQTSANAPQITITTYSVTNRIRTNLNSSVVALTPVPSLTGNAQIDAVNTFASSNAVIDGLTTISGKVQAVTATGAVNNSVMIYISPTHGTGYCVASQPNATPPSCSFAGTTFPCKCYLTADLLIISLGTTVITAGAWTFALTNLVNPDSVSTVNDVMTIYTIDNGAVADVITYTNSLPLLTPGSFFAASITPSILGLGYVDVTYDITMQTMRVIPSGGSIKVTFPGTFVFQTSVPPPYCVITVLSAASTAGVSCVPHVNVITITNYMLVAAGKYLEWQVRGVKHPATGGASGAFMIQTTTAAGLVIDSVTLPGFNYGSAFAQGLLTVPYISASPSNAGATAEYILKLIPTNSIGAGGYINIQFPSSQYPTLPTPPSCRIWGGVTTFASCVTSGTSVTITIDKDCAVTTLIVSIFGVVNPSAGITDLFSIYTGYDGVTLDQSGTSVSITPLPQAVITSQAPVLAVNKVLFTPMNEGEKATYTFTITPAVAIQGQEYITINFPVIYDKRIGDNIVCWATGLTGNLKCPVVSAYQIQVQGNDPFTACATCTISVNLYGVLNPRLVTSSNTGYFQIGVLQGNIYQEFNSQATALNLLPAPSYNGLNSLTCSNFNSRDQNTMVFNMTTTQPIPMNTYQGAVWIVFPSAYFWDGSIATCSSSSYWANGTPTCSRYYDTIRVSGSLSQYVGTLIITVKNVPNPQSQMTAPSIIVKTYDGFNAKILDSSYVNLNPTSFAYTYPGPLITVNQDSVITVQQGTATPLVPIELAYPCALNLTLTPSLPGFTLIPPVIELSLGQIFTSFRISAPANTVAQNYVLMWTTSGEVSPPYYTPLAKIVVAVVSDLTFEVAVDDIDPVTSGGVSVPVRVSVPCPPDLDITLEMTFDQGTTNAALYPDQLHFTPGDSELFFTIQVVSGTMTGQGTILVSITGTNSAVYYLSQSSVSFSIVADQGILPVIPSIAFNPVAKSTAGATISGNTLGTVYYMYAYAGTKIPGFPEVKTGGPPPSQTTRSLYGYTYLHSNKTAYVSLTGLIAGRDYSMYAYLSDQLGRTSNATVASFITAPLAVPVSTSIRIAEMPLNDVEVGLALNVICLLLSLEDYRAPLLSSEPSLSQPNMTMVDFYVVDSPFSDAYQTPADLVTLLATMTSQLVSRITNFDIQLQITAVTLSAIPCAFTTIPVIGFFLTNTSVSISVQLVSSGEVSAIAIANSTGQGTPYSWQIEELLDASNIPTSGIVRTVSGSVPLNDSITGLQPNTGYQVYFTCGNAYPTFANLLPDANIQTLSQATSPTPSTLNLNLNISTILTLGYFYILTLLM